MQMHLSAALCPSRSGFDNVAVFKPIQTLVLQGLSYLTLDPVHRVALLGLPLAFQIWSDTSSEGVSAICQNYLLK